MRVAFLFLLTVFVVLSEPILGFELSRTSVRPDLLLLPFVVAVVRWPGPHAVVWAGGIGLICDCLAGSALGPRMGILAILSSAAICTIPRRPLTAIETLLYTFGLVFLSEMLLSQVANWEGNAIPLAESASQAAKTSLAFAVLLAGAWLAAERLAPLFRGRRYAAARPLSIGRPSNTN